MSSLEVLIDLISIMNETQSNLNLTESRNNALLVTKQREITAVNKSSTEKSIFNQ